MWAHQWARAHSGFAILPAPEKRSFFFACMFARSVLSPATQGAVTPRPLYRADPVGWRPYLVSRQPTTFSPRDETGDGMQVMRYARVSETRGEIKSLDDLYSSTLLDTPDKRAAREATDKEARCEIKRRLPCWYLGGTMNGNACAENANPAGILQIDIDDTDRTEEIKTRLAEIDCVAFAAASASGRGVYALMRVPVEIQRDPDAQKGILSLIDAAVLYDRQGCEHVDMACTDLARRRFESFDPEPLYRPDASEYEPDFRAMCRRAFDASGLAEIAREMCGDATPGGASTAVALAALAVKARGRVKGRVFGETYYATRFQGVILGDSGAGKSTMMKDPLEELAVYLGADIIQPESHRALELAIVESCTSKSYQAGENGKPDKEKPVWTQIDDYRPLLAVYDEAGAEQEARRSTEYKKKMESVRRQAFDTTFKACKSINTPLPTFPLKCSYTDVRISTPKAWASAMLGTDATAGDARRVLEFWLDTPEAPSGAICQPLAQAMYRIRNKPRPSGVGAVKGYMDFVVPDGDLMLDGQKSASAIDTLRGLQASAYSPDFETIVCNLATAIEYAGGGTETISRGSILSAWAVYLGVLENRRRLSEIDDASPQTKESQITEFLLKYIGTRGTVRKCHLRRMLTGKGEPYIRAFDVLVKRGAVVVISGKSPYVRLATDEEMESAEAAQSKVLDFSEERANRSKCAHVVPDGNADSFDVMRHAEFASAERDVQIKMLDAYLSEHLKGKPWEDGVDNGLRSLACKLRENGMWDCPITQEWFSALCVEKGHVKQKDIDRVSRPMKAH